MLDDIPAPSMMRTTAGGLHRRHNEDMTVCVGNTVRESHSSLTCCSFFRNQVGSPGLWRWMNAVCRRLHSTLAPEVVYELILGDLLECFDVTFVFNPIKIKRNSRKARFVSCSFLQRPCLLTVKFTPNHHAIICTGCFFFVIKTSQRRRLAISSELCFPASSGECLVNTSISWRIGPASGDSLLPCYFVHKLSRTRPSFLVWHMIVSCACRADTNTGVGFVARPAWNGAWKNCDDFCFDGNSSRCVCNIGILNHRGLVKNTATEPSRLKTP